MYASVYKETNPLIWDTSQKYGQQLIWISISSIIGMMILVVDEKFFYAFAYPIYVITIVLLILVLLIGTTVKGSASWIEIGGFRMQPAEFAKFGTALELAKFLSGYNVNFLKDKKVQFYSAVIIILPMVIILLQNETGSTLVFTSLIFVLFREGLPGWILFTGFMLIAIAILALLVEPIYIIIGLVILASIFLLLVRRTKSLILLTVGIVIVAGLMVRSIDYVFENVMQAHQRT